MSPVALVKRLSPLRNYLSQSLDRPVIIETTKTAKDYVPLALSRQYDFIMTSPSFALKLVDSDLYKLKLTQTRPLAGHLVVLANSPIKNVTDLAGKIIGTPPASGFLGSLSHQYFATLGLTNGHATKIHHFHSHNDAISALRLNEIQASFIASFMKKHLDNHGVKTRTIAQSKNFPGLTVLTSTKLDTDLSSIITKALLKLKDHEEGRKLLDEISLAGFRLINITELEKVRPYLNHSKQH